MKLWIDTEFNGYNGEFISIGIVDEKDVTFYEAVACVRPDEWVEEHVIPVINAPLTTMHFLQKRLEEYLSKYDTIHVIADWPDDIAYLCKLFITGPGMRIYTPSLTMEIRRDLDGAVSAIPHNALEDALAIKEEYLRLLP